MTWWESSNPSKIPNFWKLRKSEFHIRMRFLLNSLSFFLTRLYAITKWPKFWELSFQLCWSQIAKKPKKSLPGSKLTFVQHFKALNFEEKLTKEKKMFCLSQELVKLGSTILKFFSMIQDIQKIPSRRHNPGIFWERTQPTPCGSPALSHCLRTQNGSQKKRTHDSAWRALNKVSYPSLAILHIFCYPKVKTSFIYLFTFREVTWSSV